jgi:hypothetical protein
MAVSDVDLGRGPLVDPAGLDPDYDHTVEEGLRFMQLMPTRVTCLIVPARP